MRDIALDTRKHSELQILRGACVNKKVKDAPAAKSPLGCGCSTLLRLGPCMPAQHQKQSSGRDANPRQTPITNIARHHILRHAELEMVTHQLVMLEKVVPARKLLLHPYTALPSEISLYG